MKKYSKRLVLFLLIACLLLGQTFVVNAASKKKDTISLNKSICTIQKGKSINLKATLSKSAKAKGVVWTSSNQSVATVTNKGKVTAKKNGKTTITAKIKGTKKKATCKLVVGTPVSKVRLNCTQTTLQIGESTTLKCTVSPKKPTNKKINYSTSDSKIATVSKQGKVTAVAEGTAKITAKAADGSGKKAVCTVTVKSISVTSITLDQTTLTLKPGDTKQLTATVAPENAQNKSVTWSSSNADGLSVANGLITAKKEGNYTITATTANNLSATCSVKVAYPNQISDQTGLNQALSSNMSSDIVLSTSAATTFTIPNGNYSNKTLTIDTPNAEIINNGTFKNVVIKSIADNTYVEKAHNTINVSAKSCHLVIEPTGSVTINLNTAGQSMNLENKGNVSQLTLNRPASISISGTRKIPVSITKEASNTTITTASELEISSSAKWKMNILPGGENTIASVDNTNCLPKIAGIGIIPVVVTETNENINIIAKEDSSLGITKKVAIEGNIIGYTISENSLQQECNDFNVSLIPYSENNAGLTTTNYTDYLENATLTTTDVLGQYTFADVTIGNYWMIFEKEGFVPVVQNTIVTSVNTNVYQAATISLIDEKIANGEAVYISGTVKNGQTNEAVNAEGITLNLRAGSNMRTGQILASTKTDSEGKYSFDNVAPGIYTVEIYDLRTNIEPNAVRYTNSYTNIIVVNGYNFPTTFDLLTNPKLFSITGQGLVQFTLHWGTEESGASSDIDSHLLGPKTDGNGRFHVFYRDKEYYGSNNNEDSFEHNDASFDNDDVSFDNDDDYYVNTPYADLDYDDTDYEGPEHITINQETPGVYSYYLHNYSESGPGGDMSMMMKSSIYADVTIGSSSYRFNCPNELGNTWHVCDYDSVSHTITPVNKMYSYLYADEVGLTEEEILERQIQNGKDNLRSILSSKRNNLNYLTDNEAYRSFIEKLNEYEAAIQAITTLEEITALEEQIDSLSSVTLYEPSIAFSDTYDRDYYYTNSYDYENEKYTSVLTIYTQDGTLDELSFEESADYATAVSKNDEGIISKLTITDKNGFVLEYQIQIIKDTRFLDDLKLELSRTNQVLQFLEQNDSYQKLNSLVQSVSVSMNSVTSSNEADELLNQLIVGDLFTGDAEDLYDYYSDYRVKDYIDNVFCYSYPSMENTDDEYLNDYYEYTNTIIDENDISKSYSTIELYYVTPDTSDENLRNLIDKTTFYFYDNHERISYQIVENTDETTKDRWSYVLKATDSLSGLVRNYYIQAHCY